MILEAIDVEAIVVVVSNGVEVFTSAVVDAEVVEEDSSAVISLLVVIGVVKIGLELDTVMVFVVD